MTDDENSLEKILVTVSLDSRIIFLEINLKKGNKN